MKRFFLPFILFLGIGFAFSSCDDDSSSSFDPVAQAATDDNLIKEYLAKDTIATEPKTGKTNWTRTDKGIYYVPLKPGTGTQVQTGNTVRVHYIGRFLNGTKFDSSWDKNSPLLFVVGARRVIEGWDLALPMMKAGEKARFYIPSALAYGPGGSTTIPANAVLVFDIDLLEIKN